MTKAPTSAPTAELAVSQREYARLRGVSHRAVQRAIEEGRLKESLVRGASGVRILPTLADREWAERTHPGQSRAGRTKSRAPDAADEYRKILSLEKGYKAQLARLEFERLTGTLVPADEVKILVADLAKRARERLMQLPDLLAQELAAERDVERVRAILFREVREALKAVAKVAETGELDESDNGAAEDSPAVEGRDVDRGAARGVGGVTPPA